MMVLSSSGSKLQSVLAGTYGFLARTGLSVLLGTLIYAATGAGGSFIMRYGLLGGASIPIGSALVILPSLAWFAMALRRALSLPAKGIFGLWLGWDELRLAVSAIGVGVAASIVAFLIFVFLVIFSMILVALAGYSAETLSDPAFFQDSENVQVFLATREGIIVQALGFLCLVGFSVFLMRILPFAAGVIAQQRIVILQAVAWTRGETLILAVSALLTLGPIFTLVFLGQKFLVALMGQGLAMGVVSHLLACFGAFSTVGLMVSAYRCVEPVKEGAPTP